jgi:hypothetical protein
MKENIHAVADGMDLRPNRFEDVLATQPLEARLEVPGPAPTPHPERQLTPEVPFVDGGGGVEPHGSNERIFRYASNVGVGECRSQKNTQKSADQAWKHPPG